ncbi:TIGR03619 family F420-dependent LLM class oxidoreductase [Sporichthya brevicatena]|uniref:TIGR03619 family F420-dependent LLM class oxidoreductase n=1 Tax=Sporichthya brevicatena TaxID=171442 RepID=A0ABN1GRH3_9ACTN
MSAVPVPPSRIGLFFFYTETSAPLRTLARIAEDAGIESIWVPEHSHIPAAGHTQGPLGEMPEKYSRLFDPFQVLATVAAVTERIRLGTGVSLIGHHDPILLAKTLASLDHLSDGRLLLGIGAGWNRGEIENHGVDFSRRWARALEHLAAMKAIWTQEEASFHGEWVHFDRIWSWPKCVQQPHIPVLLGNINPTPMVARHGDGWLPLSLAHPGALPEGIETLRQNAREAGRDPDGLDVTVMCLERTDPATVAEYLDAGASRVVLRAPLSSEERFREYLAAHTNRRAAV